jgi:hypothetical protein
MALLAAHNRSLVRLGMEIELTFDDHNRISITTNAQPAISHQKRLTERSYSARSYIVGNPILSYRLFRFHPRYVGTDALVLVVNAPSSKLAGTLNNIMSGILDTTTRCTPCTIVAFPQPRVSKHVDDPC